MIVKLAGTVFDKLLDVLWPLEIRANNYLLALNGADRLADAEADTESWEPDELWAAAHMQDGDLPKLASTTPRIRKLNSFDGDTIYEVLTIHQYIPSWGHCWCQRDTTVDTDELGLSKWRDHIAVLTVDALNEQGEN